MAETLDLDAIKARCEAATAGPWDWGDAEVRGSRHPLHFGLRDADGRLVVRAANTHEVYVTRDDAEFIAHARQDIPALIAEIERLRSS